MEQWLGCQDGEGGDVEHGSKFYPRSDDYCYKCLCHNGTHEMCVSASCGQPPHCEKFERVEKTCCTFICSNGTTPAGSDALSTAGIRLAASTATCVLIVVIILLLMHKLRRNRLFLNIRQGLRGSREGADASVVYTSAYDAVDIDISYQPLHVPGAPPPYSPTCDDLEQPPAYSTITDNNAAESQGQAVGGIINDGCQTTPTESLHNIAGEGNSQLKKPEQPFTEIKYMKRTCGVGASNVDLSLTVDLSDSCKDMREDRHSSSSSISCQMSLQRPIDSSSNRHLTPLPVRLEPDGGELTHTPCPARHSAVKRVGTVSRSADSSPTPNRRNKVTLTQYGFIDDGGIPDSVDTNITVVGLREEQLANIAACKPDRLNARVRRQNRIKRNSKRLSDTSNAQ